MRTTMLLACALALGAVGACAKNKARSSDAGLAAPSEPGFAGGSIDAEAGADEAPEREDDGDGWVELGELDELVEQLALEEGFLARLGVELDPGLATPAEGRSRRGARCRGGRRDVSLPADLRRVAFHLRAADEHLQAPGPAPRGIPVRDGVSPCSQRLRAGHGRLQSLYGGRPLNALVPRLRDSDGLKRC
jgi:hypothetical protein